MSPSRPPRPPVVGADDLAAAGADRASMDALPRADVSPAIPADWRYMLRQGCLADERPGRNPGDPAQVVVLADFDAWITRDDTLDDGTHTFTHVYRIEGRTARGEPLQPVDIPADKFARLDW